MLKNKELDEKICIFNRLIKISIDKINSNFLSFKFSVWYKSKNQEQNGYGHIFCYKTWVSVPSVEHRIFRF